jgi:hypothetical protein
MIPPGKKFSNDAADERRYGTIRAAIMKKMTSIGVTLTPILLFMSLAACSANLPAQPPEKLAEFQDKEYGYAFQYPRDWQIRYLPEGEANKEMRFTLEGPNGTSFMGVVEKADQRITKKDFAVSTESKDRVQAMMAQAIEQTYKSIAENLKAVKMTVGEQRDLSNRLAVKFYVATLDEMPGGRSIIVAGIHSFPFEQDYSINFIMTAFLDGRSAQERETLTAVFNSFHINGEHQVAGGSAKPEASDVK